MFLPKWDLDQSPEQNINKVEVESIKSSLGFSQFWLCELYKLGYLLCQDTILTKIAGCEAKSRKEGE